MITNTGAKNIKALKIYLYTYNLIRNVPNHV